MSIFPSYHENYSPFAFLKFFVKPQHKRNYWIYPLLHPLTINCTNKYSHMWRPPWRSLCEFHKYTSNSGQFLYYAYWWLCIFFMPILVLLVIRKIGKCCFNYVKDDNIQPISMRHHIKKIVCHCITIIPFTSTSYCPWFL